MYQNNRKWFRQKKSKKSKLWIHKFQFECCMAGWKRVGSVDICSAPCCPGYREVVEKPPYLQAVSFCVKGFIASAEIQNSKSIIQNPKSKNLAPKPITNSSDSFTNLEFQIYEFFNEFLLWFLFQVANWKKKTWTNNNAFFFFNCSNLGKLVEKIRETNWWKKLMNSTQISLFGVFCCCNSKLVLKNKNQKSKKEILIF